jgi:hypothetical protein
MWGACQIYRINSDLVKDFYQHMKDNDIALLKTIRKET